MIESISAGATSAHASAIIDRFGFNTAHFVQQQITRTAGATSEKTVFTLYEGDALTATFTVVDSATVTMYTIPIYSASLTAAGSVDDISVDLVGLQRYIQAYATGTGVQTYTSIVTVACILGDAETEPAV
jgi:thiamine biosynthesis protein ThiC